MSLDFGQKAAAIWHIQRIKRMVRSQLATDALVSVRELTCVDPACPGPAVQVTILGFDLVRRSLLMHRSAAEVTERDLIAALSGMR